MHVVEPLESKLRVRVGEGLLRLHHTDVLGCEDSCSGVVHVEELGLALQLVIRGYLGVHSVEVLLGHGAVLVGDDALNGGLRPVGFAESGY